MMIWPLILVLAAALIAIFAVGFRYLKDRRQHQMDSNEHSTAVTLWEFSRTVKARLAEVSAGKVAVLDFNTISMPRGPGYKLSLELTARGFSIWAVPKRYGRTGRLSFYVGNAVCVRAMDRAGEQAGPQDPEYI
jgi:hypothetical protein